MAGKIFMGIFKWLLVPVALAFIGYAFIGPKIGQNPPATLQKLATNQAAQENPSVATASTDEPVGSGKEWPAPKVDVELRRLNGNRVKDRQIHKTPEPKESLEPKVTDENAPEEPAASPEDENVQPSPEDPPPADLPEGPGN